MNNTLNSMPALLSIQVVFYLIGLIVMLIAGFSVRDTSNPKRWTTGLFWFLFGIGFLFGDGMIATLGKALTHKLIGIIVLLTTSMLLCLW